MINMYGWWYVSNSLCIAMAIHTSWLGEPFNTLSVWLTELRTLLESTIRELPYMMRMMTHNTQKSVASSFKLNILKPTWLWQSREEKTYHAFQQLLCWVPCICSLISSQSDRHQLNIIYQKISRSALTSLVFDNSTQLNWGADSARGDDAASMKLAVASWLNESSFAPDPPIHSWDKTGCSFYNNATVKLLCPVYFD